MAQLIGAQVLRELAAGVASALAAADGMAPPHPCRRCADALLVDDVAVSVISPKSLRLTVCASSDAARTLDEWQFSLGEGPCMDAVRLNAALDADVTDPSTTPWPLLAAKARELGYVSIAGVPITIGAAPFAAIDLQARSGPISSDTLARAATLAVALAHPLADALARTLPSSDHWVDGDRVNQATGMVSAQMDVSVDEALNVLRARAWSEDRTLSAIADDVVDRRLRFEPLGTGSSSDSEYDGCA